VFVESAHGLQASSASHRVEMNVVIDAGGTVETSRTPEEVAAWRSEKWCAFACRGSQVLEHQGGFRWCVGPIGCSF
jgi:hypothetical protein